MAQVIVVGGGLAGLSAAHTILERGGNVLLIDKQGQVESHPLMSVQLTHTFVASWEATRPRQLRVSTVPGHRLSSRRVYLTVQRSSSRTPRNPYVASFSLLFKANSLADASQARELARDDLIRVLTGRSGDAVNWLQDRFALDLSKVARLGGHSQPRTHRGDAQFPGMVRATPSRRNVFHAYSFYIDHHLRPA
jgi:glycine/D-amino acid oxidase-like deaminating enzyme